MNMDKKFTITPLQEKEPLFIKGNSYPVFVKGGGNIIYNLYKNIIQNESGYEYYIFGIQEIDDVWSTAGALWINSETKYKLTEKGKIYESSKSIIYNADGTFSHS